MFGYFAGNTASDSFFYYMIDLFRGKRCFVSCFRENRRDSFDPQRENLVGEDSICMVNLLEISEVIFFFSYYIIDWLELFQKRSFVLSSEH